MGGINVDHRHVGYADSRGTNIAFIVLGDGPVDLVVCPAGTSHLDSDNPVMPMFERLASFSRVILFDPRGCGLSDPIPTATVPTTEERVDDIRAVLDATGSERAAVLAQGHGGPAGMLLAGTNPDRISSLVLYGTYARWRRSEDYPVGMPPEVCERFEAEIRGMWGTGGTIAGFLPSLARDEKWRRSWARSERMGASPAGVAALMEMWMQTDVRDIVPAIRVPSLVMHSVGDPQFRVGHGRYLAQHIPGAKYVELPGSDHFLFGAQSDVFAGEIEEFVTGKRSEATDDRVLATVLFTDIVGSTEAAADLGDRSWRDLLDRHDDIVRRHLGRNRGEAVRYTGDGVVAIFDGPARAVRCACAIRDAIRGLGLQIRAGLHTGEIERRGDDVSGVGVHIAARVAAAAQPGEVLVSSTVKDLVVGSKINFEDRGTHSLKGIPDEWRLLAVEG